MKKTLMDQLDSLTESIGLQKARWEELKDQVKILDEKLDETRKALGVKNGTSSEIERLGTDAYGFDREIADLKRFDSLARAAADQRFADHEERLQELEETLVYGVGTVVPTYKVKELPKEERAKRVRNWLREIREMAESFEKVESVDGAGEAGQSEKFDGFIPLNAEGTAWKEELELVMVIESSVRGKGFWWHQQRAGIWRSYMNGIVDHPGNAVRSGDVTLDDTRDCVRNYLSVIKTKPSRIYQMQYSNSNQYVELDMSVFSDIWEEPDEGV